MDEGLLEKLRKMHTNEPPTRRKGSYNIDEAIIKKLIDEEIAGVKKAGEPYRIRFEDAMKVFYTGTKAPKVSSFAVSLREALGEESGINVSVETTKSGQVIVFSYK